MKRILAFLFFAIIVVASFTVAYADVNVGSPDESPTIRYTLGEYAECIFNKRKQINTEYYTSSAYTDFLQSDGELGLPYGISEEDMEILITSTSPPDKGWLEIEFKHPEHKNRVMLEFYFSDDVGQQVLENAQNCSDSISEVNGHIVYSHLETLRQRGSYLYLHDNPTRIYTWKQDRYVFCLYEQLNIEPQFNLCSAQLVDFNSLFMRYALLETIDVATPTECAFNFSDDS